MSKSVLNGNKLIVGDNIFEVVNEISKGYKLWNIGHHMADDYLPLIQTIEDSYNVDTTTMKAIYVKDAQIVLKALGRGQNTVKTMDAYIKKYSNSKNKSTLIHVERLKKAVKILRTIKGCENLIN